MLDDSQDPTPLLKEIRDDKTATIVVDANTTMSHIILERVSALASPASCVVRALCLPFEQPARVAVALIHFRWEASENGQRAKMFSAKINCRCVCRSPAGQILTVGERRQDPPGLQKIGFCALFL